jgi:hypothetical protein
MVGTGCVVFAPHVQMHCRNHLLFAGDEVSASTGDEVSASTGDEVSASTGDEVSASTWKDFCGRLPLTVALCIFSDQP